MNSLSLDRLRDDTWRILNNKIETCRECARLVAYREQIGRTRRKAFRDQEYWSRPLTGFGDPNARIVVIGLAPAAHGGNRTGRIFTGDRSADFLIRAMWQNGLANQSHSSSRDDGLVLKDTYLTLPVRCAPPGNKPSSEEFLACRKYLDRELDLLCNVRVVVTLGSIALNSYLSVLQARALIPSRAAFPFAHGARFVISTSGPVILTSYHPSQQNTFTGRLTEAMLGRIFFEARKMAL